MDKKELEKVYEPKSVESRWSELWAKKETFRAPEFSSKDTFSMVIPPPNITGSLHMGHALNNTLQDILARHMRLTGKDVLWVPGTDHAGIATQNVVEKKLHAEGTDRHKMGREKFIERVWKWKEESGGTIVGQLKRLGASCDWSREAFTMNEGLSKAVQKVFVDLFNEGLIYRDERLINWCPRCHTALSDIEVEHEESAGKLYHIRYHLSDDETKFLTVATTRPETMLGDTAVAINPDDDRHKEFAGKTLNLPLTSRKIPIVEDKMVDTEFGTGAVKITPAHDFNDFEAGVRHNLKRISIFDENAHVKDLVPDVNKDVLEEVKNLHAHKAREKVIHILKEQGFITKTEDHDHAVGKCYRCKTVIEPYLSPQWYVKTKPLAEEAIKAVQTGATRIIPKTWENTYFEWMRNIKDWCVSRQIWWGHRIPAYYCDDCNKGKWAEIKGEKKFFANAKVNVRADEITKCPDCGSKNITRETDVLDTWFSSALWPFSTLGWPEKTKELEHYYPTSTLVTGFDIIFFWVARMMMMGLKFMGKVPFKDVYIHALVRDAEGQKMSKSKGNVIDPLTIMDKYGTDALRFTLTAMAAQGRDVKLSEERIEGYRNFCNKIWNLARFTLMNVESAGELPKNLNTADKWILSKLFEATKATATHIERYEFDAAARSTYAFTWHEICDWYVELIKQDLRGDNGEERKRDSALVLLHTLKGTLKMLNPFMPFITEEIYSYLPGVASSITEEGYSKAPGFSYGEDVQSVECAIRTITAIRNVRTELNLPLSAELTPVAITADDASHRALSSLSAYITKLARLKSFGIVKGGAKPEKSAVAIVEGVTMGERIEVHVPVAGLIDAASEIKRLSKELEKTEKELGGLTSKLSNEEFVKKAPEEVVRKDKARVDTLNEKKAAIKAAIERVRSLE
ncbi:MAG: valine--tRNA ligase [Deltaproteobacteria bacterium]|nr:valine--tRNA ligase [Deltaproteobacteria bacterium]